MSDVRLGAQQPSTSYTLPYTQTDGAKAIELYNSTGRTAQQWQELLLYDILALNDDGLYVHTKYGYSIPRRNGKNEVVAIREMYGLVNGERILHSAHRTTTTHTAWERLLDLLTKANVKVTSSYRAFGKEHIKVDGGGVIEFRTRTSKGGLGEGFDLLVIDEAQEYQDDQESALKYVVSDSQNPQTLFCGTPPTATSSGMVFSRLRDTILQGKSVNSGWAEWSVDHMTDPNDVEAWYQCNPSLGTILTERKIQDEIGNDDLDFNIQRLGLWIRYSLKSDISLSDWNKAKVGRIKPTGQLSVGVKFGKDGANVALSVAVRLDDGSIFIECVDCVPVRNGLEWIIAFLSKADYARVAVDGVNGQKMIADEMKARKLKGLVLPTVGDFIQANSMFEQSLFGGGIKHNDQPSLRAVATACEKRAIGSNGGFGYRSLKAENDIAILDSAILAHWLCATAKEKKKQKISY